MTQLPELKRRSPSPIHLSLRYLFTARAHRSAGRDHGGLTGLLILLSATLVAYALAQDVWLAELFTHFRPHFAAATTLAWVWALYRRQWRRAGWAAALLIAQIWPVAPWLWPAAPGGAHAAPAPQSATAPLQILHANVYVNNTTPQALGKAITQHRPDIIALAEITTAAVQRLSGPLSDYPFRAEYIDDSAFGLALYAKLPLSNARIAFWGPGNIPSIYAEIQWKERRLHLFVTHPQPPISAGRRRLRDSQLAAVAAAVARTHGPKLVIGDLNTTMWSPVFERFLRQSGLADPRQNWGVLGTWPAWLPWGKLPIDHILNSPELTIVNLAVLSPTGSDHLPLLAEVTW